MAHRQSRGPGVNPALQTHDHASETGAFRESAGRPGRTDTCPGALVCGRGHLRPCHHHHERERVMPKFIIERELPGAGALPPQELKAISQKSCDVLRGLGPQVQWQQSYVTGDKIYCVYIAPSEELIR